MNILERKVYLDSRAAAIKKILNLNVEEYIEFAIPPDGVQAFRTALKREQESKQNKVNEIARFSIHFNQTNSLYQIMRVI